MKHLVLYWALWAGLWAAACKSDAGQGQKNVAPPLDTVVQQGPPAVAPDTDDMAKTPEKEAPEEIKPEEEPQESLPAPPPPAAAVPAPAKKAPPSAKPPEVFADVAALDPSIRLDIRYATRNNFTQSKIYDCPACLLRPEAATAIVKAHKALQKKGMALKMFDCYRPRPYQQRLWDKVPNPNYVTPPAKGSMHSRGAAVDLTITDQNGKELDMGTPYDFFGEKAHYDYRQLPTAVLNNRRLLRETMEAVGFQGIRTEWWHFSFRGENYPLSDYLWDCK